MKEIKLTQGQIALVDDEDYDYLMQWKWYASEFSNTFYAVRSAHKFGENTRCKRIYMHRTIMGAPQKLEVDHIDHNGLNNQKNNLRLCSHMDNQRNKMSWSKSGYSGVHYKKDHKKYIAYICVDHKNIFLGHTETPEMAALLYNIAAIKYFGEFANLNIIDNEEMQGTEL